MDVLLNYQNIQSIRFLILLKIFAKSTFNENISTQKRTATNGIGITFISISTVVILESNDHRKRKKRIILRWTY